MLTRLVKLKIILNKFNIITLTFKPLMPSLANMYLQIRTLYQPKTILYSSESLTLFAYSYTYINYKNYENKLNRSKNIKIHRGQSTS